MDTPPQSLFSRRFGSGARQVLGLHCTIAHSGAWRGLAGLMQDQTTFVTPDMLSHGRSPDWDGQGDFLDRMVQAVSPMLTQPMDLVGHSFGAVVALRLAAEMPDRVRSLTMIEPVFFAVAARDDPQAMARHIRTMAPVTAAFEAGDDALAARLFNRRWGGGAPRWPDLSEPARAAMIRGIHVVPSSNVALYGDQFGLLRPGALDRVRMPVLLLRGGESDPIVKVIHDGLAHRLPQAQCRVVPGAGHMLPITHPDATADHLRAFFTAAAA